LVDGFLVLVLRPAPKPPVLEHLGVQEVLVDRGQLVVERLVEVFDDLLVAFHGGTSIGSAHNSTATGNCVAERESCSFPPRRGAVSRRVQAAVATTGRASAVPAAWSWSSSSMPEAVSTQQPQLEPQPVRIISSGIPLQPASAASRISASVTPWHRQTYKEWHPFWNGAILAATENDCQLLPGTVLSRSRVRARGRPRVRGRACPGRDRRRHRGPGAGACAGRRGGAGDRTCGPGSPAARPPGGRTAPGGAARWHRPRA